jgi:transposase InsO family protein
LTKPQESDLSTVTRSKRRSTVDFVQRAIRYFRYQSKIIQTDNGAEFTYIVKTEKVHPFDMFCKKKQIRHQLIRLRTPQHNGKVK